MPEHELSSTTMILLGSIAGVQVLLLAMVIGISRKVTRIDRSLAAQDAPTPQETETSASSGGGAFESFLAEDSSRQKLPKNEQFAEYRKWRQAKGLNWSNS